MGYEVEFGGLGLFLGGVSSLWAMGLSLGCCPPGLFVGGVSSLWAMGLSLGGWGYFWVVCLLCGLWG